MLQIVLIGIGAGFAASLLFASPLGGSTLAMPLFALTALPVAIAGLGWTPIAAAIAALTGATAIFIFLSPSGAGLFLLLVGLPVTWLVRLVGLSREGGEDREWYPLGRVLVHTAAAVAIGLAGVGFLLGYDPVAISSELTDAVSQWLAANPDISETPTREEVEPFVRLNVALLPYTLAAIGVVVVVVNLWLASLITRASGRLLRPREPLWTASLPTGAGITAVVALAASFLPSPLGELAALVAGAFGAALTLIGLAVVHALTFGNNGRAALLAVTYVILFLFGFLALALAALGLAETFLNLRARRFGGAPPPT